MKQLWSPWRINYIRGVRPPDCVFCSAPQGPSSVESLVLFRGRFSYVMMNRYPYTNGHLMIIPYAHLALLTDVPPAAQVEMLQAVNMSIEVLQEVMNPQGFNVGLNLGASAGAGIRDHLHYHVVPRWVGDTNFMGVIGETNVIVEGLPECFAQLKPAFDCRCGPADPNAFRPVRGSPADPPTAEPEEGNPRV
jgi:ATP adenylyltransferase